MDETKCIKFNGTTIWSKGNNVHRLEGPAFVGPDGTTRWWLNGIQIEPSLHPFNRFSEEHNLSVVYEDWPAELQVLFQFTYKGI